MYAYGKVIIERPNVRAIPASALVSSGDDTFYWRLENDHAVRTNVRTGVSDGEWIEVTERQAPAKSGSNDPWVPIDGSDQVIVGDVSALTEGQAVCRAEPATHKEEVARAESTAAKSN